MVNEQGSEPHVPVWEKAERSDETFSRSDFSFDESSNTYTCPNGNLLYPRRRNFKKLRGIPTTDGHIRYRASERDCGGCALKQRCSPNTPARKVTRSVHESARDVARVVAQKPESHDAPPSQKGRDPVRAHEAHPESGSTTTARTQWSERGVSAHGGGAKSQANGEDPRHRSAENLLGDVRRTKTLPLKHQSGTKTR